MYEHVSGAGWNWSTVGSGITSLVSDATGNVFALRPSERARFTSTSWVQAGTGTRLAAALPDWSATPRATYFARTPCGTDLPSMSQSHRLELEHGWKRHFQHDQRRQRKRLQLNPVGGVVYEHVQGRLELVHGQQRYPQPGRRYHRERLRAQPRLGGAVYEHYPGTGWSWRQVEGSVSDLISDATGNVYSLDADHGVIYEHVPGRRLDLGSGRQRDRRASSAMSLVTSSPSARWAGTCSSTPWAPDGLGHR